ncbi:MAG: hypothetical protein ACFFCS_17860 [Candidatus Hodarchaeota archaeon]
MYRNLNDKDYEPEIAHQMFTGLFCAIKDFMDGVLKLEEDNILRLIKGDFELRLLNGLQVHGALIIHGVKNLDDIAYNQLDTLIRDIITRMETEYKDDIDDFNATGESRFAGLDDFIDDEVIDMKENMFTLYNKSVLARCGAIHSSEHSEKVQKVIDRLTYYNTIDDLSIEKQHVYNKNTLSFLKEICAKHKDFREKVREVDYTTEATWKLFQVPYVTSHEDFSIFKK